MISNFKAQFPINKMLRIKLKNKLVLKKIDSSSLELEHQIYNLVVILE
jgi:hypothetical protein